MTEVKKNKSLTAYELAKELEYYEDDITVVCDAAIMLRQQQTEIEVLKEQLHWLVQNPVKELTDEEIWDFINALCLDMGDYWELTERNAIPMIRTILKKAQEK